MGYVYMADLAAFDFSIRPSLLAPLNASAAAQATSDTQRIQAETARSTAEFNKQQLDLQRQQAEAAQSAATTSLVTGVASGVFGTVGTIVGGLFQSKAEEKIAKMRGKTDVQIEAMRQQSAERQMKMQLDAQLAAARIPPPPPFDWKPIVMIGGGTVVMATLIYVLLKD